MSVDWSIVPSHFVGPKKCCGAVSFLICADSTDLSTIARFFPLLPAYSLLCLRFTASYGNCLPVFHCPSGIGLMPIGYCAYGLPGVV